MQYDLFLAETHAYLSRWWFTGYRNWDSGLSFTGKLASTAGEPSDVANFLGWNMLLNSTSRIPVHTSL